jgi:hypothetical protein
MKTKTLFFISILLLLSNVSFSQLKNFGIKGGLNLSNAELESEFYSNFSGMKNKTGFNVYLTYDFLNCTNIILTGEAGYSQKGFNEENPLTDEFGNDIGTWTIYNRLNYIDVNAIAEFILRNKSVSPYFSLGPVISFYTGYNTSTTLTSFEPQILEYEDQTLGNLKSPILGFIAGAGIEINKVIPQTIITEVRYNFDLTNSFNNGYLNYKRNYLWQFNLGVKF